MIRRCTAQQLLLLLGLLLFTAHCPSLATAAAAAAASVVPPVTFGGPNIAPPPEHFLLSAKESAAELAARSIAPDDPAWKPPPTGARVLVLGSGGLVGRAMKTVRALLHISSPTQASLSSRQAAHNPRTRFVSLFAVAVVERLRSCRGRQPFAHRPAYSRCSGRVRSLLCWFEEHFFRFLPRL